MSDHVKTVAQVNIGVESSDRQAIADSLATFLADTYLLYLKTQNFHWNVTGPHFPIVHALFEQQYEDLAAAVDAIAERIRALGFTAPASFAVFLNLTTLQEAKEIPPAKGMIEQLLADHEAILRTARKVLADAEKGGDEVTADLINDRLGVHEKTAWMLRSSL